MLVLPDEIRRERLISPEYRRQQEEMHKNPDYGTASEVFAEQVAKIVNAYGVQMLLDYGAGKGALARTISAGKMVDHPLKIQQYDPAIPEMASDPEPCEMVVCLDVLEHIEPNLIENVLDDLKRVTQFIGFFTVATEEAMKTLPDGRNAHLIVEGPEWWLPKFLERFELHTYQKTPTGFAVLVTAHKVEQH